MNDLSFGIFLVAVEQKASLEKEAKLRILEAGVADVSTLVSDVDIAEMSLFGGAIGEYVFH